VALRGTQHNGHVPDLQQTVDAVWRMEAAKIVATLTRAVGRVGVSDNGHGSNARTSP